MKTVLSVFMSGWLISFSYAANIERFELPELGPFTGLEFSVGTIKTEKGQKFLIVETPEGTRLIKTAESLPEMTEPYKKQPWRKR